MNTSAIQRIIAHAHRWFKNGDHPNDFSGDSPLSRTPDIAKPPYRVFDGFVYSPIAITPIGQKKLDLDGRVVARYKADPDTLIQACAHCGHLLSKHGQLVQTKSTCYNNEDQRLTNDIPHGVRPPLVKTHSLVCPGDWIISMPNSMQMSDEQGYIYRFVVPHNTFVEYYAQPSSGLEAGPDSIAWPSIGIPTNHSNNLQTPTKDQLNDPASTS